MTHLPYIAAVYALGVGVPMVFGILAWRRLGQARRKLLAIDPRVLNYGGRDSGRLT